MAKRRMDLSEEARLKRNEYMREYRKRNPEKIKAINEKYWETKALQAREEQLCD